MTNIFVPTVPPKDCYSRLPAAWWPDFGPTPSSDSSGVAGICHDISGTDGLAFPPGVEEDMQVPFV